MENSKVAIIDLSKKIVLYKNQYVMLDSDVAEIYGVQTKDINRAVKNNPQKFPEGYVITPGKEELANLRLKIFTANSGGISPKSRYVPKLFTERGLYMLATILKGEIATRATLSIIETYAQVRELRNELVQLHNEKEPEKQKSLMNKFGATLSSIVMPDLQTDETETSLELNFIIGKIKHTVKRRRVDGHDEVEQ